MTEIENTLITHQIYFERYKTGEVNKLLQLLEDANTQIKKLILETKTIGTKKHYEKVITEIKKLAAETRSVLESTLRTDGFALTESELDYLRGKMIKTIGADINFIKPSSKQVFEAAMFIPLSDTATFESFLNSFENGLFSIWDSAIRTGYITGQSTKQVVKDVLGRVNKDGIKEEGLIKTLENSVKRNTRTAMQAFANEAHRSVYEQNDDLFIGYKYLATLDTRTCILCGSDDAKTYKSLKDAPVLPRHHHCRCIIVPIVSMLNYESERASMDGPVSEKVTFEDWLREQSAERQRDVLGPMRYKLFAQGIRIKEFVSDGRVLTLKEFREAM